MEQEEWEEKLKLIWASEGWTCDRDDETNLGFSCIDGEFHWIRDYNKKTRSFVHYNGNQIVTLVSSKE